MVPVVVDVPVVEVVEVVDVLVVVGPVVPAGGWPGALPRMPPPKPPPMDDAAAGPAEGVEPVWAWETVARV